MAPPRTAKTLPGIQLLRGAAALAVVFHHLLNNDTFFPSTPDRVVALGQLGVDVFFVVSGLIMYHAEYDRAHKVGVSHEFLVRRFIRIWPLYALFSAGMAAAHLSGLLFKSRSISIETILKSLLLYPDPHTVLVVGWTLHYEAIFYMVFALFLLTRSMDVLAALLPLTFITVVPSINLFYSGVNETITFFSNTIILEFCLGILVGYLFRRTAGHSRHIAWMIFLCGIIGFVLGSLVGVSESGELNRTWRFLYWGLPSALIVYSSLCAPNLRSIAGRAGLFVGDASYSLYLTHSFAIVIAAKLMSITNGPQLAFAALALAGSLFFGAATYIGIERPLTKHLNQAWAQRRRKRRVPST